MPGVQRHKVITTEGFIYVIGGSPSLTITNSLSTIFRAKINEGGDLGLWENLNDLPYSVHSHTVVVSNSGQIYIVGRREQRRILPGVIVFTSRLVYKACRTRGGSLCG